MPPTRSCADRLHQLQKDMGFTDKELKEAVKRHTTPREVPLPTFHEKLTKYEKAQVKATEKGKKKRKYKLAYWYLEEYLIPSEAKEVYLKYLDFKELINYAYEMAMNIIELQTFVVEEDTPAERLFKILEGPQAPKDYDIPEELDKEFEEYCEKHPLKSAKDIIPRRKKFRKRRAKKRRALYSKHRMRMYDPLFAATTVDAKQMYNELKRIGRENEIRCQKFKEMMSQLVRDHATSAEAMRMFDKRTEAIMKQHEKRLDQFAKQAGLKPNRLIIDFAQID